MFSVSLSLRSGIVVTYEIFHVINDNNNIDFQIEFIDCTRVAQSNKARLSRAPRIDSSSSPEGHHNPVRNQERRGRAVTCPLSGHR